MAGAGQAERGDCNSRSVKGVKLLVTFAIVWKRMEKLKLNNR